MHQEMDIKARLVPMGRNRHTTFIRKESHEILVDVNSVKLAVAAKKGSGFQSSIRAHCQTKKGSLVAAALLGSLDEESRAMTGDPSWQDSLKYGPKCSCP